MKVKFPYVVLLFEVNLGRPFITQERTMQSISEQAILSCIEDRKSQKAWANSPLWNKHAFTKKNSISQPFFSIPHNWPLVSPTPHNQGCSQVEVKTAFVLNRTFKITSCLCIPERFELVVSFFAISYIPAFLTQSNKSTPMRDQLYQYYFPLSQGTEHCY